MTNIATLNHAAAGGELGDAQGRRGYGETVRGERKKRKEKGEEEEEKRKGERGGRRGAAALRLVMADG